MKAITKTLSVLLSLLFLLITPTTSYAATFRAGDRVEIDQSVTSLSDLYASGGEVFIDTTINNDLTVAGGNVTIDGEVTGGLLAAGGTVTIRSDIANSARVAGGNILIEGHINRDLIVAGGSVTVASDASINGDLVFTGGSLMLRGPVRGNVIANGGEITLNNTVGGNVEGNMGHLTLSENTKIDGDLRYTSREKAKVSNGAVVRGKQEFKEDKKQEQAEKGIKALVATGSIYKLVADIVFAFVFVWLLNRFTKKTINNILEEPVKSVGLGLVFLIITPILSLILLIVIWLGITMLALYFLVLLISLVIGKLVVGWWILNWWEEKNNKKYALDWKAAVLGPVALFLIALIPIIGWLALAIVYLISVGGVTTELLSFISSQKEVRERIASRSAPARKRK